MWVIRLIIRNAGRHKLRTALTIVGLAIAVLAFCIIRTLVSSYYASADVLPPDRLVTRNAVSIVFDLPQAYKEKIENVPGVVSVGYGTWFGGLYKNDMKNFFPNFAVGPDYYIDIYSEFVLTPDEKEQYLKDKSGAIAGAKLADRFGWKVGDPIRLTGQIYPGEWDFTLRGIYKGSQQGVDENSFLFHYEYLDDKMKETVPEMSGAVGWYVVKIADPTQGPEISANIDALFKNSPAETMTETEKAFSLSFLAQMDTIITGLRIMSYLIIGVILLVLVNTMAMSARERISEYAVLKTLGFRPYHLGGLILGESLLIAFSGGILGIILTFPVLGGLAKMLQNFFSGFKVEMITIFMAIVFTASVGFLSALFPIYRAVRIKIVEGLRNVG
ncbi:MAG TPA: ABC transporter ATP-binding protein [candidate division Zixibacteria bacterium]|nr:ABC transporter ATP-binding protein [candidate division Zixibacteria bacterium]